MLATCSLQLAACNLQASSERREGYQIEGGSIIATKRSRPIALFTHFAFPLLPTVVLVGFCRRPAKVCLFAWLFPFAEPGKSGSICRVSLNKWLTIEQCNKSIIISAEYRKCLALVQFKLLQSGSLVEEKARFSRQKWARRSSSSSSSNFRFTLLLSTYKISIDHLLGELQLISLHCLDQIVVLLLVADQMSIISALWRLFDIRKRGELS